MMQINIQDQTLAMYLEKELGVEILYPKGKNPIQGISEALSFGSGKGEFSFQVPGSLKTEKIIATIKDYFQKTDPNIRMGETGGVDDDQFWIFQDRREVKGEFEIVSSIRCLLTYPSHIFHVD